MTGGHGRLLEDLLTDLAFGVAGITGTSGEDIRTSGLRPISIELRLPIETRVVAGSDGMIVRADVPQSRTRTPFDVPLGRLSLTLVGEVTP
jgi:hypothetical protein